MLMKTPEITLKDFELIFNKLEVGVGSVVVSFYFSKIFVYKSAEFVFKNILKNRIDLKS